MDISLAVAEYQRCVYLVGDMTEERGTNGNLLDFRRHLNENCIAGDAVILPGWLEIICSIKTRSSCDLVCFAACICLQYAPVVSYDLVATGPSRFAKSQVRIVGYTTCTLGT